MSDHPPPPSPSLPALHEGFPAIRVAHLEALR